MTRSGNDHGIIAGPAGVICGAPATQGQCGATNQKQLCFHNIRSPTHVAADDKRHQWSLHLPGAWGKFSVARPSPAYLGELGRHEGLNVNCGF
jgi:hypothetical protein